MKDLVQYAKKCLNYIELFVRYSCISALFPDDNADNFAAPLSISYYSFSSVILPSNVIKCHKHISIQQNRQRREMFSFLLLKKLLFDYVFSNWAHQQSYNQTQSIFCTFYWIVFFNTFINIIHIIRVFNKNVRII